MSEDALAAQALRQKDTELRHLRAALSAKSVSADDIFKQLLQEDAIEFCQIDSCRIAGPVRDLPDFVDLVAFVAIRSIEPDNDLGLSRARFFQCFSWPHTST